MKRTIVRPALLLTLLLTAACSAAEAAPITPKACAEKDDPKYDCAWQNGFLAARRENQSGRWITMFGATLGPGREADVTHIEATHSPTVRVDQDRGWTLDLIHGYVWPSGWGIAGKVGYDLENDPSVKWTVRDPGARVISIDSHKDRWQYGVYVVKSWGR